jgi:hypothetical protein
MRIAGHEIRDYFRLLAPLLGLIAAVWALRLVLAATEAPPGVVRACSVSVAGAMSVLLAVLLMHMRRFGGYLEVVVATLFLIVWEQVLISAAIAFTILTGIENVYSAPEYSFRGLGHWQHIAGHMTFGVGSGTLLGSLMGCLLLWLLRKMVPLGEKHAGA